MRIRRRRQSRKVRNPGPPAAGRTTDVADGRRVGYAELVDLTLQSLYRAADWAVGAAILQQLYEITSPTPGSMTMPVPAAAEDLPVENVQEALFANVCSETHNPSDPFAYSELAARVDRRAPYVGAFWTYSPCRAQCGRPGTPTATTGHGGSGRRTRRSYSTPATTRQPTIATPST
jgi:hypothetical protein